MAAASTEGMVRVRHLFISPGHNFKGHHGGPPGAHPIHEVDAVQCVAGQGLRGDRYFGHAPDFKGQVTFFSWDIFCDMRRELSVYDAHPSALRRNVITEGVNLLEWIGVKFEIQGVTFEGIEDCKPCYWMDQAIGPGADAWLKGRGGLRAKILSDGWLRRQEPAEKIRTRRMQASDWPEHEFE